MYNENSNFSIKNIIIQFLFVALFIFLLIWLFPLKSDLKDININNDGTSILVDRIFNENIIAMKDGAKDYFTLARLPKNVGDKVKITLGEMLEKKIVLPFTDKNGDTCSLTDSYVEVTKYDEEYIMKVNLKCGEEENYLLVYMGCYDYCSTTMCEKNKSDIKTPVIYSAKTEQPVINNTVNNNVNNNVIVTPTPEKQPEPEVKPSTPSCSLKVTSGTLDGNNYIGTVVIGFASKNAGENATITSFGLGTTVNYNGNTSYKLTKPGTYKVNGYVKNSFGKTTVCSKTITIVETKKPEQPVEYLYEYSKTTPSKCTESNWSNWSTTAVTANSTTSVQKKTVTQSKLIGYNVTKKPDYSKPIYGTKEIVVGKETKDVCTSYGYVKTGEYSYGEWTYVDTIYLSYSPTNTDTVRYIKIGESSSSCGENCTATTTKIYEKETRTKTPITKYQCTKWEQKEVDITTTIQVVTGYEMVVVSKEPVYKKTNVTYYRYKTKSCTKATTDTKYSYYNDKALLNAGYNYTGNEKVK